jgi:hypothetical protein
MSKFSYIYIKKLVVLYKDVTLRWVADLDPDPQHCRSYSKGMLSDVSPCISYNTTSLFVTLHPTW